MTTPYNIHVEGRPSFIISGVRESKLEDRTKRLKEQYPHHNITSIPSTDFHKMAQKWGIA